jgi:hypothetical protein
VWKESHQPVPFPSCGSIKVFLETITILLGFDSFVDDAVVGEHSELAGFQVFWYMYVQQLVILCWMDNCIPKEEEEHT